MPFWRVHFVLAVSLYIFFPCPCQVRITKVLLYLHLVKIYKEHKYRKGNPLRHWYVHMFRTTAFLIIIASKKTILVPTKHYTCPTSRMQGQYKVTHHHAMLPMLLCCYQYLLMYYIVPLLLLLGFKGKKAPSSKFAILRK